MKKYDVVIVGSGFSGSILARKYAEDLNKTVLVIEKRDHIAGNMYDYNDEYGIRIQKYGPHAFHTNIADCYNYISNYCELIPYKLKTEVLIDDAFTPCPFNFKTIDQFYSKEVAENLKKLLNEKYGEQATVLELLQSDNKEIREYAEFLFENDYKPYTSKQWGIEPAKIDTSVLKRVPLYFNYQDTYFLDNYQVVPKNGYAKLFQNIINHPNIDIMLNTDALKLLNLDDISGIIKFADYAPLVIFTGATDELFDYRFGKLPYRSLYFEYKYYDVESMQNAPIVVYPKAKGYTRVTEFTKLPVQNISCKTVLAYEYPLEYDKNSSLGNEPYYPVLTEESKEMYSKYLEYSRNYKNLVLCGRLADFKYYNMDQIIKKALDLFDELKNK